jgi:hypothetical protein
VRPLATFSLCITAWLLGSTCARAEWQRAHLELARPIDELCPSSEALEHDVEQLAGRAIFTEPAQADVLVRGSFESSKDGIQVHIAARDAAGSSLGTRALRAPAGKCAELRRPLALVLTMLLDRERHDDARRRKPTSDLSFGAGIGLLSGTLPRVTPGPSLLLGANVRAWLRLRAEAAYWLPVSILTPRGVGAKLQAIGLTLTACTIGPPGGGATQLWLCGGAQLGASFSQPRKLEGASLQARLLAQALLELRLSRRIASWSSLEAALGPIVAFSRPQLTYERSDGSSRVVYRPSRLGAIVRLAIIIGQR